MGCTDAETVQVINLGDMAVLLRLNPLVAVDLFWLMNETSRNKNKQNTSEKSRSLYERMMILKLR